MKYEESYDPFEGEHQMTKHTEKNVSAMQESWEDGVDVSTMTDKQWEAYIYDIAISAEPEKKYRMKCKKCGHEENVPAWIIGELAEGSKEEVEIECPKCNGGMRRI